jgi:glutamate dehydrogenase
MGFMKMWGYEKLIHTNLPDSAIAQTFLEAYFPHQLHENFHRYFIEHPLHREIIATSVVNYIVNNGGIALLPKLFRTSNADYAKAFGAYLAADAALNGTAARRRILEGGLSSDAEYQALLEIENALESAAADAASCRV